MSKSLICVLLLTAALGFVAGCPLGPPPGEVKVPKPINLLLPKEIRFHFFSAMRKTPARGVSDGGIDVRIEAIDSFGDETKAFGTFRFELYAFRPNIADPKGTLINTWELPVLEGTDNLRHWESITRTYLFKLQWDKSILGGQPFVLRAVFSSPFTERLVVEQKFEGK